MTSNGKPRLRYDFSDYDTGGGMTYMEISCTDGKDTLTIITNLDGDGLFHTVETPSGLDYVQDLGTSQFHLPRTKAGIRRLMRDWFYIEEAEPQLTYEDYVDPEDYIGTGDFY